MANELDEMTGPILEEGNDVNVIAKKLSPKVGFGSKIFEFLLWFPLIIPGIVFIFMKINAKKHFDQLQQKINSHASTIDNYLDQRLNILQNTAKLLDKAIDLDKDTFTKIAAYRSGVDPEADRNAAAASMDEVFAKINVAMENYPNRLEAHDTIDKAMQQNDVLQRQIRAARDIYNDAITKWNTDIYAWPTKMIVAAKNGYQTRIPFAASQEVKKAAQGTFF